MDMQMFNTEWRSKNINFNQRINPKKLNEMETLEMNWFKCDDCVDVCDLCPNPNEKKN